VRLLAPILAALCSAACLVEVREVSDPEPAFREARAEAARLQGRPGPARSVNVLSYDPRERELTRLSVPFWLVRKAEGHVDLDELGDERAERALRALKMRDLERAGLGALVEVAEDDGERVLVWLR
jgi:hypothetical protein